MAIRCGVGHVLFRGRHPTFTPEDRPFVVDKDLTPDVTFTFIDVIPGRVKPGEYHTMGQLIEEANIWLSKNLVWEVINCETVLLFFKSADNGSQHLAPEDTCFPLDGDAHMSLMGLRLWMKRKDDEVIRRGTTSQILKFAQFTPRPDDDDETVRFKKLDKVLERINDEIQMGKTNPMMGDIITIETLYFPANSNWKTEDECKIHFFPSRCISLIRIFYVEAKTKVDQIPYIGIKDFVPQHIGGGSLFKKPTFEPLSDVISRASDWMAAHPEADFKNAQCLEVKMKIMGRIDSRIMSHTADRGDYIRIFRVCYTCKNRPQWELLKNEKRATSPDHLSPQPSTSGDPPPEAPIYLSSIIFTPAGPEATVQEIRRKIHEWVEQATRDIYQADPDQSHIDHRPRLLSAETVEIFTKDFSEEEIRSETENTFKYNRIGTMNSFLYMAFRVYFDVGFFGRQNRSKSIASTISTHGVRRSNRDGCSLS